MSNKYSLGVRPSSPAHLALAGENMTLCGLPLNIFGRPLRDDEARIHRECATCARVEKTAKAWREKAHA